MTTEPIYDISIFQMEKEFEGKMTLHFWWSLHQEAPFIRGTQWVNWGGPFISAEKVLEDAKRRFGARSALGAKVLPARTQEDEPQFFWDRQAFPCYLEISIPLDEFSERAFALSFGEYDYSGVELASLFECLKFEMRLRPVPLATKLLLLDDTPRMNTVDYHEIHRDEGAVTFAVSTVVVCHSKTALTFPDIRAAVKPVVQLDPLYPDIITTALMPREP